LSDVSDPRGNLPTRPRKPHRVRKRITAIEMDPTSDDANIAEFFERGW
jgi:hypothetical protein